MSLDTFLRQRVTIRRSAEVLSTTGVATRTWSDVATDVPFNIQQQSGRQVLTDPGRLLDYDAVAYCRPDVDVRVPYELDSTATDRVVDGTKIYDVLGIADRMLIFAGGLHHKRIFLALAPAD